MQVFSLLGCWRIFRINLEEKYGWRLSLLHYWLCCCILHLRSWLTQVSSTIGALSPQEVCWHCPCIDLGVSSDLSLSPSYFGSVYFALIQVDSSSTTKTLDPKPDAFLSRILKKLLQRHFSSMNFQTVAVEMDQMAFD